MTIKDIVNLVNAGYTRAEIEAMQRGVEQTQTQTQQTQQTQTQQTRTQQTQTQQTQQTQTQQTQQTQTQQTQTQQQTAPADLSAQIAALTAAIQANGIVNSNQPKTESAEDILASLLDPNFNK